MEILALQYLRDRVLGCEPHKIICGKLPEPAPVKVDHSLLGVENFEYLCLVRLRVLFDLLATERRARGRASRGIANHAREVADHKNRGVAEVLKVFELAQHDRVAEVQVGSSRVHSELHAQRLACRTGLFKFGAQFGFADDFRCSLLDICELFVYRREPWHGKSYYTERCVGVGQPVARVPPGLRPGPDSRGGRRYMA